MMTPEQKAAMEEWLKGRPPIIRELAERFHPGVRIMLGEEELFLLGYRENGGLIVTPICPGIDYDGAMAKRRNLCPECVDQLTICTC